MSRPWNGNYTLDTLAFLIRANGSAHGFKVVVGTDWEDDYKIPAHLALLHSEVSEALEDFRNDARGHFLEELADVQIRLLDLAGGLTTNFSDIVRIKMAKNEERPYKHGGKRI